MTSCRDLEAASVIVGELVARRLNTSALETWTDTDGTIVGRDGAALEPLDLAAGAVIVVEAMLHEVCALMRVDVDETLRRYGVQLAMLEEATG